METVPLDMDDIFDEQANEDDFPSVGPLPDLPDDDEVGGTQASEDAENSAEILSRLKDLSKGAAKQVVRRPQPKLDATRLTGDRGIPVLPKVFQDVKFKGKGQEAHDLQIIMRYLEHWAHRLFPKMPFDEVLERIERLGTKNEVKTCIKKMRLDMPVLHEDFGLRSDEEIEDIPNTNGNSSTAEIDLDAEEAWDEMIREEEHNTQTKMGQGMNAKSQLATQLSLPLSQTPSTPSSHLQNGICPSPGLTPEQVERMERNKLQALARRSEKQSTFKTPAIPKSPARKVSSCTSSPHAKGPHGAAGVCSASHNQHAVSSPSSSSSSSLCTQSSPSGKVTSQGSSPHRGDQSQPTFLSLLTSQDTGTEDQGEVIPNVSASTQDDNHNRVTNHISSQINGTLNDSLVVKQCHTTNSSALEMSEVIPMIQKVTNQNSSQVNSSTRSNVWPSEQDGVSSPKKVKGDLNLSSGSCDQVSEEELMLHLSESD